MKIKRLVWALATLGLVVWTPLQFADSFAALAGEEKTFDPLFDGGRLCAPAKGGSPALLKTLVMAKAETAPFKPGQAAKTEAAATKPPVLYTNLGALSDRIATTQPRAQAYFDQGLRLVFGFNHAEAIRAFKAAQAIDPACAMCYWGEALALGPNINSPMMPEAVEPAVAAAKKAQQHMSSASGREQALIAALAKRYSADPKADRGALDKAYADAMTQVAREHRSDDTVQVLFAEALMDLSPWNYWEAAGAKARGRTQEFIDALERVLERNPNHPGAIHYYIHTMEASTHADKALPYARNLGRQMPGAGHIVHMPAHIYYRVGLYKDSLKANIDAIRADEAYFKTSDSDPMYKGAYYPHNVHFVLVSALMGGDGKAALDAGAKLDRVMIPDLIRVAAPLQPVKAAPYFAHERFSDPATILALPDPGNEFALVKAMWHYVRAIAHTRQGELARGEREIAAIAALEKSTDFKPFTETEVPAREIMETARHVATGRLADARGDLNGAIKAFEDAMFVQDSLPYTEPPYWYYPVRQSLAALQLRAGKLDEAEKAFRDSLAQTPANGWALQGLIELYRQRGDKAAMRAALKRLDTTWLGKKSGIELKAL